MTNFSFDHSEWFWETAAMLMILKSFLKSKPIRRVRHFDRDIKIWYWTLKVKLNCKSYEPPIYINNFTAVTPQTTIGRNASFYGLQVWGNGNVTIGENFRCGSECVLITAFHDYDTGNSLPYDPERVIDKDIVIEANVWLGYRVIILGGVRIGEGAIIQAGSVVVRDIPRCAIAGGHPARPFATRDITHYERLKQEGRVIDTRL